MFDPGDGSSGGNITDSGYDPSSWLYPGSGIGGSGPLSGNGGTGFTSDDALSSILNGLAGGFMNQPQTTNTNFNQNTTGTQSGTASNQRTLTPYQQNLQSPLFQYISQLMSNPQKTVAPFRAAARDQVNNSYNGLADTLRQQFMANGGGGKSGKFGTGLVQGNLQRLGQLGATDTAFDQTEAQLPLQGSELATQLLGMPFGSTSAANSTSSSDTTGSSQSTTKKGGFLSSALGAGLGIAASFL